MPSAEDFISRPANRAVIDHDSLTTQDLHAITIHAALPPRAGSDFQITHNDIGRCVFAGPDGECCKICSWGNSQLDPLSGSSLTRNGNGRVFNE
jgi:hypothetical protein